MNLKLHILCRLGIPDRERNRLFFKGDRIYSHRIFRINYTTYNVRRAQDVINPATSHCNVMMLADDDSDPHHFWYARVLGVYHANVIYTGTEAGKCDFQPRRIEFLWVRWYEHHNITTQSPRLDTLSFVPLWRGDAFDFLDPSVVIRGCHIVPKFAQGKPPTDNHTPVSSLASSADDYYAYYANR